MSRTGFFVGDVDHRAPPGRRANRVFCWTFLLALAAAGCASTGNGGAPEPGAGGRSNAGGATGVGGPIGTGTGNQLGAGLADSGGGSLGSVSSNAPSGVYTDGGVAACSDGGCSCIRIASIGHQGIWGACGMYGDSTTAFENWLNTQSTAKVDTYATKPTLTADFLAPYNVIILQWLRDVSDGGNDTTIWDFSSDEIAALTAWVKAGGGLITMSGYDGDSQEVAPLNALLSFTDFSYNRDGIYGSTCSNCWGGACALTAWDTTSPIGAHLSKIGIQNGRSISVAPDAGYPVTIDCPCPYGAQCAVHEDIGKGHVFAFTDEWVTYTSQWLGSAPCISDSCAGQTPADDFQVPQFWYNAIRYAASAATCFVIQNPNVIPIR